MAREGFIKYWTRIWSKLLYFDPLQISNRILKAELSQNNGAPSVSYLLKMSNCGRVGNRMTNIFQSKNLTRLTECERDEYNIFTTSMIITIHFCFGFHFINQLTGVVRTTWLCKQHGRDHLICTEILLLFQNQQKGQSIKNSRDTLTLSCWHKTIRICVIRLIYVMYSVDSYCLRSQFIWLISYVLSIDLS